MVSASRVPEKASLLQSRWGGFTKPQTLLLGLLLPLSTIALYYPVHHYPFFEPDDYVCVTGISYYRKVLEVPKDARMANQAWANIGHVYSDLGDQTRDR